MNLNNVTTVDLQDMLEYRRLILLEQAFPDKMDNFKNVMYGRPYDYFSMFKGEISSTIRRVKDELRSK